MFFRSLLTALMLLVPLSGFTQSSNWLPTIDLNINPPFGTRLDLYTDGNGVHTLIHLSNQLTYCLFSCTGTFIRETVIDNFSESPMLSRMTGYGNNIYIVYKKGPVIHIKKSTDAGVSWSNIDDIQFENYSNSNGLDAWADADGLHVVYSEAEQLEGYPYDTYYQRSRHNENNWIEFQRVTDNANDQGGFPAVTTSPNRVHVTFTDVQGSSPVTTNAGFAKTRDRSGGNWENAQELFDGATLSFAIASNTKLHGFYYDFVDLSFDLYTRNRDSNSTSWSQPELLLSYAEPGFAPIDAAVSADDKVHIVYGFEEYREWDATNGWSPPFAWAPHDYTEHARISTNSNDVFIIWNHATSLKLRQRDFAPLAPTNLSVSVSAANHPLLSWDANDEADMETYNVWKDHHDGTGWFYLTSTSANSYEDTQEAVLSGGGPKNGRLVEYKVAAVDLQGAVSAFSNIVSILVQLGNEFLTGDLPTAPQSLSLGQNYPNPFNPSTTIHFALPEAQAVQLRVYDLTGRKVNTLLEDRLEAGFYDVVWEGKDAQDRPLSSGIYLYQLQAGEQRLLKKMILVK